MKKRIYVGLGATALLTITALVVVSLAHATPPVNIVPVQPQFVAPPWTYEWGQVVTYTVKLRPNTFQTLYGEVQFQGFGIDMAGSQVTPSPIRFTLEGHLKKVHIRFRVPASGAIDAQWCVEATVYTEGAPQQMVRTCAEHDTGK